MLEVADRVTIRGSNYGAVALGTATLLQALRSQDGRATVPGILVTDEPAVEYRGLLVDVARQYHSIPSLKQIVELCRLYKIRYLQLHLTDDQSFMFPSKAFPELTTQNHHGGKTYSLEELRDWVAYADARNVTIVPRSARCCRLRRRVTIRELAFAEKQLCDSRRCLRCSPGWVRPGRWSRPIIRWS